MRRRTFLAGGAATVATLAGCTSSGQVSDDPSTNTSRDDPRTISVRKSGEVEAEPDLAVLEVAVEAQGEDASSVRDDLSERSDALYDALLEYGLDEDDVTTGRFDVRERIDRAQMREDGVDPETVENVEEYRYYQGTHSYTVEVHDPENVGEVIDVAVDAGADSVGHITYTLSEEQRETLREDAVEEAIQKGRTEADAVAEQVEGDVVEVDHVDTAGGGVEPVNEQYDTAAAGDSQTEAPTSATDLRPDDVTVTATVELVYEFE